MSDIRRVLSFNDILLVPRYSDNEHIHDASIEYTYDKLPSPFSAIPIFNSPMDRVCSPELMKLMHDELNCPITIHRYFPTAYNQLKFVESCLLNTTEYRKVFIGVGSIQKWKDWIDYLIENNQVNYSYHVDMANADCKVALETVEYIRSRCPNANIMAGTIATKSGMNRLISAGANLIRAGIGSGSICSTRTKNSFGLPVLTSILDCAKCKPPDAYLLSDGGIEYPGDICKAMVAGADGVVVGKLLAKTDLAPGLKFNSNFEITDDESEYKYVEYRGMASKEARNDSGCRKNSSVEGVSGLVEYSGKTIDVVQEIFENCRASISYYGGCTNWEEFKRNVKFVEITNNGWNESLTRVMIR